MKIKSRCGYKLILYLTAVFGKRFFVRILRRQIAVLKNKTKAYAITRTKTTAN